MVNFCPDFQPVVVTLSKFSAVPNHSRVPRKPFSISLAELEGYGHGRTV